MHQQGVAICIWAEDNDFSTMGFIVDHLDSLISEWYPGQSYLQDSVSRFDAFDELFTRRSVCPKLLFDFSEKNWRPTALDIFSTVNLLETKLYFQWPEIFRSIFCTKIGQMYFCNNASTELIKTPFEENLNWLFAFLLPGLDDADALGQPLVQKLIPCPSCMSRLQEEEELLTNHNFRFVQGFDARYRNPNKVRQFSLTECAIAAANYTAIRWIRFSENFQNCCFCVQRHGEEKFKLFPW